MARAIVTVSMNDWQKLVHCRYAADLMRPTDGTGVLEQMKQSTQYVSSMAIVAVLLLLSLLMFVSMRSFNGIESLERHCSPENTSIQNSRISPFVVCRCHFSGYIAHLGLLLFRIVHAFVMVFGVFGRPIYIFCDCDCKRMLIR